VSLVVDEHRQYLSDPVRLAAFERAIAEVVRPGDVVLDLGCGTGILGLYACRAGARRVYAVDESGMIELARAIAAANGLGDRIVHVNQFSREVELPERADVVVADQIGQFGFEAGVIEYFCDARQRLLVAEPRLIPAGLRLQVALVEAPELYNQIDFWSGRPAGFDCSPAREWAANTGYPVHLDADQLLSRPADGACVDLRATSMAPFTFEIVASCERPGTLHGVGGWFAAQLSPSVVLTNSPLEAQRLARRNVFLPIDRPVPVAAGDQVAVRIRIMPEEVFLAWDVTVGVRGPERPLTRFRHSMLKGLLLSRDQLRRMHPAFVPSLTPRGHARATVLSLCDGRRALHEIELEVQRRHPELFPSVREAAAFVTEVVTRYAT
jgi:protein arginine N-methyltransferase 1